MKIVTERLLIQSVSPEVKKAALKEGYSCGPHIALYLSKLEQDQSQLNWGPWLVMLKENGRIIGDIGCKGRPDEERRAEIGYGFAEEYRNQGYATESARALVDWAFGTNEMDLLVAETANDNLASIKVLEKLGMKKTLEANGMVYWQMPKDSRQRKDEEMEREL